MAFAFIDEVGASQDVNQPYFGVGSLMVTSDSEKVCALNRQLREIFMNAMAELNINKKRWTDLNSNLNPSQIKACLTTYKFLKWSKTILTVSISLPPLPSRRQNCGNNIWEW